MLYFPLGRELLRAMQNEHRSPVLQPGRNCWRIEAIERAAFLVDGSAYFSAFRDAVRGARQQILILGWDIDSRIRLERSDHTDQLPDQLGSFLNSVVASRGDLHAYVLTWDFAMIYALEREWLPIYKLGWQTHRRLHFRMDGKHPTGASHHQKIVVIDDAIAFAGGMDLSKWRWDTPDHSPDDPRRHGPEGSPYPPFHDVQIMVDGAAAAALGDLARQRWLRATGEILPKPRSAARPSWPESVQPDLKNWRVGIARTEPRYAGRPEIRESERLHLDAIARARRYIYIENQYLTSHVIGEALCQRLRKRSGPEIVLVLPHRSNGWLEQHTMDVLRGRTLRELRTADRYGRLAVYFPDFPAISPHFINVHDKILVVDDELVRIGSANLSNRSMGLDTECDLIIEADGEAHVRQSIVCFRNRLLAEHLARPLEEVAQACANASLITAIDSLRGPGRTLSPLDGRIRPELDDWLPDSDLVDPEQPIDPERLVDRFIGEDGRPPARRHLLRNLSVLALFLLFAAAWRWTPLNHWLDVETLLGTVTHLEQLPGGPVLILTGFVIGGLIALPVTLLVVVIIAAFGPVAGFLYALGGSLLSAIVTYMIGSTLGRETVRRLAGRRINRLSRRLARRGILTMTAVRLLPIAPFTIVNIVAGASHIRFRDYVLGTLLGMTPGLLALTLFVDQVQTAVRRPDPASLLKLAGIALLIALGAWAVRKFLRQTRPVARPSNPGKRAPRR